MKHIEFLLKIKDIKNRWEKIEKFTKSDEYYLTRRYVDLPTRSELDNINSYENITSILNLGGNKND